MCDAAIHRADAFEAVRGLEEASAHAAVVDYPWTFKDSDRPGASGNDQPEDWTMAENDRLPEFLEDLRPALVDGAWVFVFADDDVLPAFREAVEETFTYRKILIWDCERVGLGHYYRSRHGYMVAATVGDTNRRVTSTGTVFRAPAPQREPGQSDTYPTAKPPQLVTDVLRPVVESGERVLEPFCGSAPTLEAARRLGLRYWGADVSEDALRRARERTGQQSLAEVW